MTLDPSSDVFTVPSSLVSSDSVNDYSFSFDLPESPCEVKESPLASNVVSMSDAIVSSMSDEIIDFSDFFVSDF